MILLLVLLVSVPGVVAQQPSRPASVPITVEYLANEGVLITGSAGTVLIDGLFGDGLPDYPSVTRAVRDSLEAALGRFGEIDLVLVTHIHDDHFNAASMARHLRANPRARLGAPPQVRDALAALAGWSDPSRTIAPAADSGRQTRHTMGNLVVEAHGVPHAGVDHLVWMVEIGGLRVMHAGDAYPSAPELRRASGSGIDLLLAPWWMLNGAEGRERIAATGARQVAAFHWGINDRAAGLADGVTVLRTPGQRVEVGTGAAS